MQIDLRVKRHPRRQPDAELPSHPLADKPLMLNTISLHPPPDLSIDAVAPDYPLPTSDASVLGARARRAKLRTGEHPRPGTPGCPPFHTCSPPPRTLRVCPITPPALRRSRQTLPGAELLQPWMSEPRPHDRRGLAASSLAPHRPVAPRPRRMLRSYRDGCRSVHSLRAPRRTPRARRSCRYDRRGVAASSLSPHRPLATPPARRAGRATPEVHLYLTAPGAFPAYPPWRTVDRQSPPWTAAFRARDAYRHRNDVGEEQVAGLVRRADMFLRPGVRPTWRARVLRRSASVIPGLLRDPSSYVPGPSGASPARVLLALTWHWIRRHLPPPRSRNPSTL
ncbi:hypothetical protein BC628DRAFT_1496324 [Trametes gibbosa]|nr:hypothetical protein BC628DRAFT_1496324 [Trametes gibbosa]